MLSALKQTVRAGLRGTAREADFTDCSSPAQSLAAFLARPAFVIPRDGEWPRNLEALERQAQAALDHYTPDAPAPEAPSLDPPRPEAEPLIRIDPCPR